MLGIFYEFKNKSCLAVSIPKTCFFTYGLSLVETNKISQSTGLSHAIMHVRYLGIPLCTGKISMANCTSLIQRVKERLSTWTTRSLFFFQEENICFPLLYLALQTSGLVCLSCQKGALRSLTLLWNFFGRKHLKPTTPQE